MSTKIQTPNNVAADATPMLAPEGVVAQLRIVRQQIAEVTPLTRQQKKALYRYAAVPNEVLQASINAIGASAIVQQALGGPADDVRQLIEESNRWTAVEDELRGMLQGVAGANLIRRQRIGLLAVQAYVISRQLARLPLSCPQHRQPLAGQSDLLEDLWFVVHREARGELRVEIRCCLGPGELLEHAPLA